MISLPNELLQNQLERPRVPPIIDNPDSDSTGNNLFPTGLSRPKVFDLTLALMLDAGNLVARASLRQDQLVDLEMERPVEADCANEPDKYERKGATVRTSVERLLARF